MGKSKEFRSFIDDDGDVVRFSPIFFRRSIDSFISQKKESGEKYTKEKFYEDVAKALMYSIDAIKNWAKGANGPNDFDIIRKLARYMGIDYRDLLVDENDEPVTAIDGDKFKIESSNEKDIIMQMYELFVDYIYWFTGTGSEIKAFKLLENPLKEQYEYIVNLYYLLDKSALNVSEEVYYMLRRFITELDCIVHARMRYTVWLPQDWTEVNPFLSSKEFDVLLDPHMSEYGPNISGELDLNSALYSCHEDETGEYLVWDGFGDEMGHLLFEDLPYLHDRAKEIREETNKHNGFLDLETNSEIQMENAYFIGRRYIGYPDLMILMDSFVIDESYDINILVCREYANTLIKLMKKRFPQYFK